MLEGGSISIGRKEEALVQSEGCVRDGAGNSAGPGRSSDDRQEVGDLLLVSEELLEIPEEANDRI